MSYCDMCAKLLRELEQAKAQPSLTPADLIALRDQWRTADPTWSGTVTDAFSQCADQLDALITRLSSETEKEK